MTVPTPSSNYMDGSPNSILSKFIEVVLHCSVQLMHIERRVADSQALQ